MINLVYLQFLLGVIVASVTGLVLVLVSEQCNMPGGVLVPENYLFFVGGFLGLLSGLFVAFFVQVAREHIIRAEKDAGHYQTSRDE